MGLGETSVTTHFFGLLGYTGWWWRREVGLLRFFFAKREIETLVVWFVVLFLLF